MAISRMQLQNYTKLYWESGGWSAGSGGGKLVGEGGAPQGVAWRVRKQAKMVYVDIVKTLLTGTLVT